MKDICFAVMLRKFDFIKCRVLSGDVAWQDVFLQNPF